MAKRAKGCERLQYLDQLADNGYLVKHKFGRSNYYINQPLFNLLSTPLKVPQ